VQIQDVLPGSLAAQAGIASGETVTVVNGRPVRDFLDLHLWLGEEELDLVLERPGHVPRQVRIQREYGRELGLVFPEPQIRRCGNDCPFCFVDQLPEGLRKNLYIRDDDYRFSYLYGHFITLTNLKEHEFERIIEQQLSPLYISVHALDPVVREKLLVSKRAGEIRSRIEQLIKGGIELHTQVVVVPGVNDGEVLRETIFELAEYYPGVQNVSVVPVGLTAHRENLPEVRTLGRREARQIAHTVRRYGRAMQRSLGTEFCYVADELVLAAGLPMPPPSYYGNFSQRENGVGLVRSALMFFERAKGQGASLRRRGIRRAIVLTGESFGPILNDQLPLLRAKLPETELVVVTVENRLFGRPTTVGGLLGGKDLLEAARTIAKPGDLVLVPDEAVGERGVFIDDVRPEDIARELKVEVAASWAPLLAEAETETESVLEELVGVAS
jgi:putative radical SAM enzyme (TIGR03279 family)